MSLSLDDELFPPHYDLILRSTDGVELAVDSRYFPLSSFLSSLEIDDHESAVDVGVDSEYLQYTLDYLQATYEQAQGMLEDLANPTWLIELPDLLQNVYGYFGIDSYYHFYQHLLIGAVIAGQYLRHNIEQMTVESLSLFDQPTLDHILSVLQN